MITDERDLARSLHAVESPPGLRLDPEEVMGSVHRADRRRRARKGAVTTGSVAVVAVGALWAAGLNPGPMGVLPAAPWASDCGGIVDGLGGTRIDLDRVAYAELPLSGSAAGTTAVVAFDACGGESGGRLAYATRGPDGGLEVGGHGEPGADTLQLLREGRTVTPQVQSTPEGEVLFGLVDADAPVLRVLSAGEPVEVNRQPLPGTGLDAYVTTEFTDPEQQTLGMAWGDESATWGVIWTQVLEVADFEDYGGATPPPLVAQSRDGVWHIWLGDEQANMEGDLGSWLAVEFDGSEDREIVGYLPSADHTVEVEAPDGGEAEGAEIRYAEVLGQTEIQGRFAWVTAPADAHVYWVDPDGSREEILGG